MRVGAWTLAALLLGGAWPTWAAEAAPGGIHVPDARIGDHAIYTRAGSTAAVFALGWLEKEATVDRWGQPHGADILRTVLPATDKVPDANRDWFPSEDWAEVREAFAGVAYDPVWRLDPRSWFQNGTTGAPFVPLVGFESREDMDIAWTDFATPPTVRSCLAHHGLQGRALAPGVEVPLATLCPAVAAFPLEARAHPARAASFLGRTALEFVYDLRGGAGEAGDLRLPYRGTLRVVVADGLPFVAEVQARGDLPEDTWHYALSAFQEGDGSRVAPWVLQGPAEPAVHPAATFAPLGPDGPADGDSGLPYRLEDALRSVRGDPTLARFQVWLRERPDAFVGAAQLYLGEFHAGTDIVWVDHRLGTEATWTIALAAPRAGSQHDMFLVSSRATYDYDVPLLGERMPLAVRNAELESGVLEGLVAPSGEPAVDWASALRAYRAMLSAEFLEAPVARLDYTSARLDEPASITLSTQETQFSGATFGNLEMLAADLTLNVSTGAAALLTTYHQREERGPLTLGTQPLGTRSAVGPPFLAQAATLEVVAALGGLALLAALLAHGGYLTVGYSRLRQSDLLDNPVRRRIYDLVRERPGIHFAAIANVIGTGFGGTKYHLTVLERGNLVHAVALPRYRRYYVTGSLPHSALRAAAELESAGARRVYEAVRREPGLSLSDLARRLEVSPVAVYKAVARLAEAGLVDRSVDGRVVRVVPRDPELN